MTELVDVEQQEWWPAAVRAAEDLAPRLNYRINQLRSVFLVDGPDLRIVLPFGHAIPEGSTIFSVPVVHADVPAPMVALGMT